MPVPVIDEVDHCFDEDLERVEDSVAQHSPLKNAEEQLHLIDPRGVDWRVVEVEAGAVTLVEVRLALVRAIMVNIEVIPNHMHLLIGVDGGHLVHELHQVISGAPFACFGVDVSSVWVESG